MTIHIRKLKLNDMEDSLGCVECHHEAYRILHIAGFELALCKKCLGKLAERAKE